MPLRDAGAPPGYVIGYDAIRVNAASLPKGAQAYAGYSTGSGVVPWPDSLFASYATALGPCLRIDQDPAASDPTADYLDVERGAATVADCPGWARQAMADIRAVRRRGQRSPAIYASASAVTSVVNALLAGGIPSGVGLIIADWNLTEVTAIAGVLAAAGPFPVVGIQFADPGPYDVNIFSRAWLAGQAGGAPAPAPVPVPVPAAVITLSLTLPVLVLDAAGEDVKSAQGLLNARGYPVTVDGTYGPATRAAVTAFQHAAGLAADGITGHDTWLGLHKR